jgi:hypothetical protein
MIRITVTEIRKIVAGQVQTGSFEKKRIHRKVNM